MQDCCAEKLKIPHLFLVEHTERAARLTVDRVKLLAPSETAVKAFLELVLVATAILTLAFI